MIVNYAPISTSNNALWNKLMYVRPPAFYISWGGFTTRKNTLIKKRWWWCVCAWGGGPNNVGVNKSRLVRSYDERFSSCRNNQGTQKNSIKYEYIYYENDWISRRGEMKTHYSRYHHPCSDVLISRRVSYTPFYVCSPDKETNCASALSKSN